MGELPDRQTRDKLLETTVADVPAELARQVASACEPVDGVAAAYVALVRETFGGGGPSRDLLTVALELGPPPDNPGEARTWDAMRAVREHLPGTQRISVLAEAALPIWRERAVRVFPRV
jgi:hypothetical protein